MPKPTGLAAAQLVMERKQQFAAKEFAIVQQHLHSQRQQLDQLLTYKKNYEGQFIQQGAHGMHGQAVHEYQAFLQRLEQGIAQQNNAIASAELKCEQKRRQWTLSYHKAKAVEALRQRQRLAQHRAEIRLQQKMADEVALRVHNKI